MLFLDLDDFKLVNDGWGHDTGDRLLREVADRLRSAVRPGDLVARLGGDEFTVLCDGVSGEREALAIAERLREALDEPFEIAGQRRHVRASIGCRLASGESAGAEALLRDADVAMYQAKDKGRDRIELYSEETRRRIVRRLEAIVGVLVLRTQLARRAGLGGWSVSGLALGGVFVTCGVSHLVAGLSTPADWHTLLFDVPGVPFSIYFLWVVRSLHRNSLRDWNRRPLVGRASRQSRPSPWAAT